MRIIITLMFLSAVISLNAQEQAEARDSYHELGFDAIPAIIAGSGVKTSHFEIELFYKNATKKGDLRLKFIVNDKNPLFNHNELIRSFELDSNPNATETLVNHHYQKINYEVNLGYAKNVTNQKLSFYFGADFIAKMLRHETHSAVETVYAPHLPMETEELAAFSNRNFSIGAIPFIGKKLNLSPRLILTVEFGVALTVENMTTDYLDAQQYANRLKYESLEINKFINDVSFSYTF